MSVKLVTVGVLGAVFGLTGLSGGGADVAQVASASAPDLTVLGGRGPAPVGVVGRLVTSGAVTAEAARIALPVAGLPVRLQWEVLAAACELTDRLSMGRSATGALAWLEARLEHVGSHSTRFREAVASVAAAGESAAVRTTLGRAALCRAADAVTAKLD